jgi:hypothetical protein
MAELLTELRRLFCWPLAQQRYGLQTPGENAYPIQKKPITTRVLEQHLAGEQTAALLLVDQHCRCRFGAIDIDTPRDAADLAGALGIALRLIAAANTLGIPALLEFSGRRGWHVLVPVADPVPALTMRKALEVICRAGDFEAEESFPAATLPLGRRGGEGKVLKLPCGQHQITNQRSWIWPEDLGAAGAIEAALVEGAPLATALAAITAGDAAGTPSAGEQAAWLESFRPAAASAIEAAAGALTIPVLERLADGEHPGCIQHLLEQGCPLGWDFHHGNGLLARYCHQRGLDPGEAEDLAAQFHAATLAAGHSTTKAEGAALKDLRQWLRSCEQHAGLETALPFRCSLMVEGGPSQAKACDRCAGDSCPAWPWIDTPAPAATPTSAREEVFSASNEAPTAGTERSADGDLHARRFWQGIQAVLLEGQELRLSTVLAAAPGEAVTGPSRVTDLADDLAEREFLAHLLANPAEAGKLLAGIELPAEAFSSRSTGDWEAWASALQAGSPCDRTTWAEHLDRLLDRASRTLAMALGRDLLADAQNLERQPADAIAGAVDSGAQLLRQADPELQPMSQQMPGLLAEMLRTDAPSIPLKHPGLARLFGGGLRPGRMVAIGGPPGCGKTTLSLQVADDAAEAGVPVLFISHEMTVGQLMASSLSRLSGINGRRLQGQAIQPGTPEAAALQKAAQHYQQQIAPRLFLLEGGTHHTPGKLRAQVQQIRRQLQLADDHAVLVVVDYLQLSPAGIDGEASLPEPLRVGAVATGLKKLARTTGCTVWALASVTKQAFDEAAAGERLGSGLFADSARVLHTADTALGMQSGLVHKAKRQRKGDQQGDAPQGPRNLLEVALAQPGLSPQWRQQLEGADRPLEAGDTYCRLDVTKNRGGAAGGSCWALYRRHLSQLLPVLPCDLGQGPVPDETDNPSSVTDDF